MPSILLCPDENINQKDMMNALYILDDSPWFEWIRLQATESTNKFVKHYRPVSPKDMVLVSADFQTEGRGQAGNSWESEEGKNLLFSLLLHPRDVAAAAPKAWVSQLTRS